MGFKTPTPIQEKGIPLLLESSQDLIGLAQTGTGKTTAFGLPILQHIIESVEPHEKPAVQALVLCPTRELCVQIHKEMSSLARFNRTIRLTAVYGGTNITNQIKSVKAGTHVVIATPGRLHDLIRRRAIDLSNVRFLVLDEADIMLHMGFKEELDVVVEETPDDRQTLLFSATMSKEVARISQKYMDKPQEITVGTKNEGSNLVEHYYYVVHAKDRFNALKRLVDFSPGIYGIIFCRTRIDTQRIADKMRQDGYNVDALHGDLSQMQRDAVMAKFRSKDLQLLVATDIAARGLDIGDLTHVIHHDLPDEVEVYNHRSGRTGRAGKRGTSCSIINMRERGRIKQIERMLGLPIVEAPVPLGADICEQQLMRLIDRVMTVSVDKSQIAPYLPVITEKLASLDRDELLQRVISIEFIRFLEYYGNVPDLTPISPQSRDSGRDSGDSFNRRERKGSSRTSTKSGPMRQRGNVHYELINLNVGRNEKVSPPDILKLINRATPGPPIPLGRIDIGVTQTMVQIASGEGEKLVQSLSRVDFGGKRLRVKVSQETGDTPPSQGRQQPYRGSKGPSGGGGGGGGRGRRPPGKGGPRKSYNS